MGDAGAVPHEPSTTDAAVGSETALAAATLAGLEGMGMGLLARWCADPGPHEAIDRLRRLRSPVCYEVEPERWRTWQGQVASCDAVARTAERLAAADARAVMPGEEGYPTRLSDDPRAPAVLLRRGRGAGPDEHDATVAIIGTRRASQVGREVAAELGAELAGRSITVLSGLARGIDAAAHRGALAVEATVAIGVIGCGPDVIYPPEHRRLWEEVAAGGGLLGEWPPGIPPNAWRFPARNRLLAALADVVVVVESARSGGSMHTVREAIDRSRPVLAVPGSVRSRASEGTNMLISEGCDPCVDVLDVLTALSRQASSCPPVPRRRRPPSQTPLFDLTSEIGDKPGVQTDGEPDNDPGSGAGQGSVPAGDGSHATGEGFDPIETAVLDAAGWQRVSLERIADALDSAQVDVSLVDVAAAVGRLCHRGALVEREGWFEATGRGS